MAVVDANLNMDSLSDLVKKRAEDFDVQIIKAKPIAESDKNWFVVKKYFDNLPNDYMPLFKDILKNNPLNVKKRNVVGGYAIEIMLRTEKKETGIKLAYEIELYILEKYPERQIRQACYVLWNNLKNVSYYRDLLNPTL